jgi:hypothetical protein
MNVGELKKFLETYKDGQNVKILSREAYEIVIEPIPEVEAEPVNKTEAETVALEAPEAVEKA